MQNLRDLDLVGPLRQVAHSDTPLLGICLGQQLLMSESEEFGIHQGLNIIPGRVVHFGCPQGEHRTLKVPQVGWNRVYRPRDRATDAWTGTPLAGLSDGVYMYFVHSFYIQPVDPGVALSLTRYGDIEFCSAIRRRNVIAFQYHPERSGEAGMRIYQSFATDLRSRRVSKEHVDAA
jgi:glutamine amidotransferase